MQQQGYTIGDFIKSRRQKLGLTQNDLASQLGWESPQFISNIERDEAQLPADRVKQIARILKVKPEQFIDMHMMSYRKFYEEKVFKPAAGLKARKK